MFICVAHLKPQWTIKKGIRRPSSLQKHSHDTEEINKIIQSNYNPIVITYGNRFITIQC